MGLTIGLVIFLAVPDTPFGTRQRARLPVITSAAQSRSSIGVRRTGCAATSNGDRRIRPAYSRGRHVAIEGLALVYWVAACLGIHAVGDIHTGPAQSPFQYLAPS